jgi:LPXTG-motif cell wall-anchored protein
MSLVLAACLLVGCLSLSAFAAETPTPLDGDSSISIHSANDTADYAMRAFSAYQIFYGTAGTGGSAGTLSDVEWGYSIKDTGSDNPAWDYTGQLISNIKASANTELAGAFAKITAASTADEVAAAMIGLGDDSEATIAFTQIVHDIVSADGYKGPTPKKSTRGANTSENAHNYVISGIHEGYYLVVEDKYESKTVTVGDTEVTTSSAADSSTYSRMILRVVGKATNAVIKTGDMPNVTKTIENSTVDSTHDTASIDEAKTFVLTSTVPDMTGYQKYYFVFNDTMSSGINFDSIQSVKIYPTTGTEEDNAAQTITLWDKDDTVTNAAKLAAGYTGADAKQSYQYELQVAGTNWGISGLTQDTDGYVTYTSTNETQAQKYHDEDHGETKLTIIFNNFIQYKAQAGWTVEIKYTGYLNHNAIIGDPSYTTNDDNSRLYNGAGNPNAVNLTYSNNPNVVDEGDTDNEDKPGPNSEVNTSETSTVYLYTAGVDLIKLDGDGDRLTGAEFTIENAKDTDGKILGSLTTVVKETKTYTPVGYVGYVEEAEGTTYYVKQTDGAFVEKDTRDTDAVWQTKAQKETVLYEKVSDTSAATTYAVSLEGGYYKQADGNTYVSKDAAQADVTYEEGYILYTRTVSRTAVEKSAEAINKTLAVGEDGKIEVDGLAAGKYLITETQAPNGYNKLDYPIELEVKFVLDTNNIGQWTYSATMNGTSLSVTNGEITGNELRVVNKQGSTLPVTGGIGTTIFYVVGTVLVLGAGVLLITRKRMKDAR